MLAYFAVFFDGRLWGEGDWLVLLYFSAAFLDISDRTIASARRRKP
jgi:hypothetical protein